MIDQISLSPRMKKSAIVSNQHGIYAFSHKLPEDVRFRTKRNKKIQGKRKKCHGILT